METHKLMVIKKKALFDHVNHINEKQTKGYWDTLSEEDRKTWSTYMIHRFLSMEPAFIEIINELQKYTLDPEMVYKFYIDVLPKGKRWLKYVKNKQAAKYDTDFIQLLSKHYEVSILEVTEYVGMMSTTDVTEILDLYGLDKKTKRKYLKGV